MTSPKTRVPGVNVTQSQREAVPCPQLLDGLTGSKETGNAPAPGLVLTDPRHGTHAGAVAHWRLGERACERCLVGARRQRKRNVLAALQGRPATVPLGHAWKVIDTMPRNQLVEATGMLHDRIKKYHRRGPDYVVHRSTRDRIIAASNQQAWTPIGLQRRLQALTALGWSMKVVADRMNTQQDSLRRLRARTELKHVRRPFAELVVAAYEDLSMTLPEPGMAANKARAVARSRGYLPPLAWDDIDDPTEKPGRADDGRDKHSIDPVIVERFLSRDIRPGMWATTAEKREIVRRWDGSHNELARLTGWKPERYAERVNEVA